MNTPYTEQNNIYTCENGHGYSYHTDKARALKEEGICFGCELERSKDTANAVSNKSMDELAGFGNPDIGEDWEPTDEETQAKWKELEDAGMIPRTQLAERRADDIIDALTCAIGDALRPLLLGKVVNPERKVEAQLREANGNLSRKILNLEAEVARLKIEKESHYDNGKQAVRDRDAAHGLLWEFVDDILLIPRHGMLLDRVREAREKLRKANP